MARINSRNKGASGEREFCNWLRDTFDLPVLPKRNLEQVRSSGADVLFYPFAFEVKRCEKINEIAWWSQVHNAVIDRDGLAFGLEPVVAYRVNRGDWTFLISAKHIGLDNGYIRLTRATFVRWVKKYISNIGLEFFGEEKRLERT